MLEIRDLCLTANDEAGRTDILKHICLTVDDNKFVVITGPNGGGKTTLCKAIMGLAQPTAGQILWNGADITNLSITDRAKLGVCYGFQQPPRFKGMRVADLLAIAAGRKLSHDEACAYLTQVGLCARDYLSRDVDASLSGGEVKRIEIATLLAKDAPLMLFFRAGSRHRPVVVRPADRDLPRTARQKDAHHHYHLASGAHYPTGR